MKPLESGIRNELNFRELGGIPVKDGRKVRRFLLFRSGGLHLFTPQELALLNKYGIRAIADLRAWYDWKKHPDPDLGAERITHEGKVSSGGEKIDFSPRAFSQCGSDAVKQMEKLKEYYRRMPFGNSAYQALMKALADDKVPLLFHCTTGKDRTGIAAMVILYLLGAEDREIMADYLLSNEYRRAVIEEYTKVENLKDPGDEGCRKLAVMRGGVLEEMGKTSLDEIHRRYASPEDYAREEYGWDKKQLEEVRNRFLE